MATVEKVGDGVRAVERALDILLSFCATDRDLTAAELLQRVDLSRATLYRLLGTLEQCGFVVSSGDPQRFRLGPAVARLGHAWSCGLDLPALARPFMQAMWEKSGETVALFVPRGDMRLCVAEMPSAQPLSFQRGVGYSERIVRGATGRAILAWRDDATPALLAGLCDGLDMTVRALQRELDMVRARGHAVSRNELISGAVAVAMPFFDLKGVAGSIGVFGPQARLDEARIVALTVLLQGESQKLSAVLGFKAAT